MAIEAAARFTYPRCLLYYLIKTYKCNTICELNERSEQLECPMTMDKFVAACSLQP